MGGYGSGWQRPKKATVEDCLVLSMATFVRKQALVPGARTRGAWGWWREGEKDPYARLGYEVDASECLGVGQKMVVIGLDRLQLKDDDLAVLLSKEQLGSLQSWSGE